jgi:hydrogenase maturation protease
MRDALSEAHGGGNLIDGRVAVIGVGQSLRGDDATGLEAVRTWSEAFRATATLPDVSVEIAELPGLELLGLLHDFEAAVIVDSTRSGAAPGTIQLLTPGRLAAFGSDSKSAHGWGVAETLRLGLSLDPELRRTLICLIGIEGNRYDLGTGISPEVREAIPAATQAIQREVVRLLGA